MTWELKERIIEQIPFCVKGVRKITIYEKKMCDNFIMRASTYNRDGCIVIALEFLDNQYIPVSHMYSLNGSIGIDVLNEKLKEISVALEELKFFVDVEEVVTAL